MDMIGQIRRAYFEQSRPIKEIVRTLRVSRATVRKVVLFFSLPMIGKLLVIYRLPPQTG